MQLVTALAGNAIAALVVGALVWALFWRIDRVSGPDLRRRVARWLAHPRSGPSTADDAGAAPADDAPDWARDLSALFDRLFGPELHSRRALLWSCLLSFGSMLVLLGLFLLMDMRSVKMIRDMDMAAEGVWRTVLGGAVFVAMMNFVPDYLSLILTRYLLRRIAAAKSAWIRAGLIVLDAALTFFTLFAFMFTFTFLGFSVDSGVATALAEYRSFIADFWWAIGPESEHPVQLCFYSTFSTSLILWLYFLGAFAIRDLARRAPRHRLLRPLFCGGQPIRAIGATAALIAGLAIFLLCVVIAPEATVAAVGP